MANVNQKTGESVQGGDRTMKNYGGSDIPAFTGVLFDTTAANVDGIVVPTAAGGVVGGAGFTLEIIPAGKTGRVRVMGVAVGTADGAITRGVAVQIDDTAAHLGQVKVKGAGVEQIGQALDTVADGEQVRVLISKSKCA